ncbi:MAG: sodium-dependent transporter [Lachnospiraceae bacterium]|nr:sodium-dependent transporter [Lachnospiraceae bacterium]
MKKRSSFGGSIGFVLAAAGSAVGLGNIWRFPYLAAKDGGGLFLILYLILALTFGYSLLTSEIAIGRKTKESPLTAYKELHPRFGWVGILACMIPMIIMPYYTAIGGWVLKYFMTFITGSGMEAAEDGYFTGYITSVSEPITMGIIFLFLCTIIVLGGVNKGIERASKFIMPVLIVLVLIIAIFSLTLSNKTDAGVRTGLQGLSILFIPDFSGLTIGKFFTTLMDAMGQLFFSLSIAMGIMVAYGSYVSDDTNLGKSINEIEIFDTLVAVLAGVMIVPAVYVFMGRDGLSSSGPGLMFISLPKVFAQMGFTGQIIGAMFFAMVLFAALTSAVSIMEAVVSSFHDYFHLKRRHATIIETIIALVFCVIVCLGYNKFYFEIKLPNGSTAQILDIMDYFSNYILMPIVAIATCILVGHIVTPKYVIDEVEKNGSKFGRKRLFTVMIKYVAPVLLFILFLQAFAFKSK